MRDAAEGRLHPIADLTKIDAYKQFFLDAQKRYAPAMLSATTSARFSTTSCIGR